METETSTTVRPFPTAPAFDAAWRERRAFRADMREAWLDRADLHLYDAQRALSAGDYMSAEVHAADLRRALEQARMYAPEGS
jgi:hypothetical protein